MQWDVRGAGAITVGDRRETLDVGAEQFSEHLGLGLTQLGKLRRDMRHRAVMLADLHTVAHLAGIGGEARTGECVRDLVDGGGHVVVGLGGRDVGDDPLHPIPGERRDGSVPTDIAQGTHGGTGEIVVGVPQFAAARRGELEPLRGAPTAASAEARRRGLHVTESGERVEMTTHTRGADTEAVGDLACRQRTVLHEQRDDGSTGLPVVLHSRRLRSHGFHNTSVT